jgi:hypothetical protein
MKMAVLDAFEKKIRAGQDAAEQFIDLIAQEMKAATPALPIDMLRIHARHGSSNIVAAALFRIGELRKELESEAAA